MSGYIGLREEARQGHLLARRITRLFDRARRDGRVLSTSPLCWSLADMPGSRLTNLLDESGPEPVKVVPGSGQVLVK